MGQLTSWINPLSLGATVGGLSAGSHLLSGLASSSQQAAQGQTLSAQAEQARRQAGQIAQTGRQELAAIDRERSKLTRDYRNIQSANAVALGAGNVDLSSGSAMDVAAGNADRFAADIGDNAYSRALKDWETREQVKAANHQADLLDSQASYARRAANNLLPTLLGAGLAGATGFFHGYQYGGNFFAKKK